VAGLQTRQRDGREHPVSSQGSVVVQILPLAQHEYINAYDTDTWRETIRTSHEQSADQMSPDPESPIREPAPESV
jgi:hypothetical protein